jgi:hypothetical protein
MVARPISDTAGRRGGGAGSDGGRGAEEELTRGKLAAVVADPLTLLLPPWMVARFDLACVLAEAGRWSGAEAHRLLERFDMSGPERGFVQTLLARRTNLWLCRCNQREACGDFVVIDLSPPAAADRPRWSSSSRPARRWRSAAPGCSSRAPPTRSPRSRPPA